MEHDLKAEVSPNDEAGNGLTWMIGGLYLFLCTYRIIALRIKVKLICNSPFVAQPTPSSCYQSRIGQDGSSRLQAALGERRRHPSSAHAFQGSGVGARSTLDPCIRSTPVHGSMPQLTTSLLMLLFSIFHLLLASCFNSLGRLCMCCPFFFFLRFHIIQILLRTPVISSLPPTGAITLL